MSRPDFVDFVLDVLAAEWDTGNFDPVPELIDQRGTADGSGSRSTSHDLAANNAIAVGSAPTTTSRPIGSAYNLRYTAGVNVRIEAVHESEAFDDTDGGVTTDAFQQLVTEARRALYTRRVNPTSNDNVRDLVIPEENDLSIDEKDYYRTDLTVEFRAYETL